MFEIVMGIDDFLIQLVKYCIAVSSTFSLGAHSMQRLSCSFQSDSQTYFLHLEHLQKCCFASFWASSKASSHSLRHSGNIPCFRSLSMSTLLSIAFPMRC